MTELIPKMFPRGYIKPGDEVTFILRNGEIITDRIDIVAPLVTCSGVITHGGILANILHEERDDIRDQTDIVDIVFVHSTTSPEFGFREYENGDVGVFIGDTCTHVLTEDDIANSSRQMELLRQTLPINSVEAQHLRAMLSMWDQFNEWSKTHLKVRTQG